MDQKNEKKVTEKKGFFRNLCDKLDKKLADKAKNSSCCSSGRKPSDDSCCN